MPTDASLPRELSAGPLSLTFSDGWLRWIRLGDREIVRGIYAAVRDDAWGTIHGTIDPFIVDAEPDGFHVAFTSHHRAGPIDFVWRAELTGTDRGALTFTMDGEARTSFATNRTGICVLHPASVGGTVVTIDSAAGSVVSAFPALVSPWQPFTDIAGMRWRVEGGDEAVDVALSFEGDVFETEDQRNWTDASFKTFSRPLRLPKPVHVEAGTRIRQSVTLALYPPPASPGRRRSRPAEAVEVRVLPATGEAPTIGTSLAAGRERLGTTDVEALRALAPATTRVVLELDRPGWEAALGAAEDVVEAVGGRLEIEAIADESARWAELLDAARPRTLAAADVLAFGTEGYATTDRIARPLHDVRRARGLGFRLGGGTRADFAELNRAALPLGLLDVVGFAVSAQVHAFDDTSVMETLESYPAVIASARVIAEGRPLAVGPVTLRPRFNPYGNERPVLGPGTDVDRLDPRQWTAFAAAWTIGALAAAERASVNAIVLHAATGPSGLLGDGAGADASPSALPLPALPPRCGPSPLYFALRALATQGAARGVRFSPARGVTAVGRRSGAGARLLVANLLDREQLIDLRLPPHFTSPAAANLDGLELTLDLRRDRVRLHLEPYGISVIDVAAGAVDR